MILLVLATVLIIIAIYHLKKFVRFKKLLNVFPGRTDTHFIFGDAFFFGAGEDNFSVFRDYNKRFPNSYQLWTTIYGAVCINTPEHAEIILSSTKYIKKSIIYALIEPWLKQGLLTSKGEKWFHRRKLLTPAFHFTILKRLTENFEEYNEQLIINIKKECQNKKTNIVPLISEVTLNIICATSMGVQLHPDEEKQVEYRKAINGFADIVTTRLTKPWLIHHAVFFFFPLYRVQKKILKILHQFTNDIIKQKEDTFTETDMNSKKKLAMLDLLLFEKKKNGVITKEDIQEEVDTFTFEGHDTVSMALSFILLVLANHREHQKKIIEEIDKIYYGSDHNATFEDLQNMSYLEMCIKECLRLFPSVPFISRELDEDVPLDDKLVIPAGSFVHVHIYDIHRNEKHFPNPEKFDPDRFLPENSKNRHPYAYIPFSAGPRNCIGQKFAMLEMKSIISNILRHFEIHPVDKISDVKLDMELVLRPKNGIHVKFLPRQKL